MPFRHLATALAVLGALAMAAGTWLAHTVQTDGGRITVQDLRFEGPDGQPMAGLLYTPQGASVANPAPGILAVHGFINSRETQGAFALELARRGHVVLALDQTGHGYSAPPAFSNGFGGPAGLAKLRSLPQVDTDNIGLVGHSMGGWAILAAAAADPDGYRSMVLLGSAPDVFGAPPGNPDFPRNLAVVFSAYDEFSMLMWDVPTGAEVVHSAKLAALFGTATPVQPDTLYGDLADRTARLLHVPPVTHPGDHLSPLVTAQTVDWFGRTLRGGKPLPPTEQTWMWQEAASAMALVGIFLFLPAAAVLGVSAPANRDQLPVPGWRLWPAALAPVLLYYPAFGVAEAELQGLAWWPQPITNGVLVWLLATAVVNLALGWQHRRSLRPAQVDIGPSLQVLVALMAAYAVVLAAHHLWAVDLRAWVVAVKPLAVWHWPTLLAATPVLLFGFAAMGLGLHRSLGHDPTRMPVMLARNIALLAGPFALFLALQYGTLFLGWPLPLGQPLLTIVAIQFLVLLAFAAAASTVVWHVWRRLWPGALLNAGAIGWWLVAGTATTV